MQARESWWCMHDRCSSPNNTLAACNHQQQSKSHVPKLLLQPTWKFCTKEAALKVVSSSFALTDRLWELN